LVGEEKKQKGRRKKREGSPQGGEGGNSILIDKVSKVQEVGRDLERLKKE